MNEELMQRITKYEDFLTKMQKELQIKATVSLEFPQFRILPEEVSLALAVLKKNGCQYILQYTDLKEKN